MFSRKQIYLILIGLCFLVYANGLRGAFVSDDLPTIVKNPFLVQTNNYIFEPAELLHSLTFHLVKAKPFLYHLENLVVHCVNTILVFILLGIFFKTEASLLGAALFAVHPIHAEAITWISGVGHLVIGFLTLLTYILYWRATSPPKGATIDRKYYWASLAIFLYMHIGTFNFYILTLPFIVFSDIALGKLRRNWKLWLPFLVILAMKLITGHARIAERIVAVGKESGLGFTWTNPIYNMAYSFFMHLGLLVWPDKLTLYHEPPVITRTLLNVELAVLAVLLLSLPIIFKKARPVFFGLGVFILFLAPTYSPVLISWLVAERYAYVASIAFCMWLAFAYEKAKSSRRRRQAMTVFVILIAMYSVRTVVRNEDWKTPQRLWLSTVQVSPFSPRAHNNMGDAYVQEGNYDGAIREFKRALELKPDYADVYHNLANTYQFLGNIKESIKNYEAALSYNPKLFESYYNLSIEYINTGELDKAIDLIGKGLQLRPNDPNLSAALQFALQKKYGE